MYVGEGGALEPLNKCDTQSIVVTQKQSHNNCRSLLRTLMHGDPETAGINSLQRVNTVSCGTTGTHTKPAESFRDTHVHTPKVTMESNRVLERYHTSHHSPEHNGTVTQRCLQHTRKSCSTLTPVIVSLRLHVESAGYGIQVCVCTNTHRHTHTLQPPHVRDPAKPGIWYKNSLLQKKSNQNT